MSWAPQTQGSPPPQAPGAAEILRVRATITPRLAVAELRGVKVAP
jgi:hypothetical protein